MSMDVFQRQMLQTAAGIGLRVIPKEKAAKLLSLCYVFGDEPFVFDEKLHDDVMKSAICYGVQGGQKIDQGFSSLLNKYTAELRKGRPDWLAGIEEEYGTAFPELRENTEEFRNIAASKKDTGRNPKN